MFSACWDSVLGTVLQSVPNTGQSTRMVVPHTVPKPVAARVAPSLTPTVMRSFLAVVWEKKFTWVSADDALFEGADPMSYIECLVRHPEVSMVGFIRRSRTCNGAPAKALGVAYYIRKPDTEIPRTGGCTASLLASFDGSSTTRSIQDPRALEESCAVFKAQQSQKRPSKRPRRRTQPQNVVFRTNKHIQEMLMEEIVSEKETNHVSQ